MVWECKPESAAKGSWITEKYYFRYDAEAKKAEVIDGVIDYVKHDFIPAEIGKVDGQKVVFRWAVLGPGSRGSVHVRYDATIDQARHTFRITSTPGGYDNTERQSGSCSIVR